MGDSFAGKGSMGDSFAGKGLWAIPPPERVYGVAHLINFINFTNFINLPEFSKVNNSTRRGTFAKIKFRNYLPKIEKAASLGELPYLHKFGHLGGLVQVTAATHAGVDD